MIPFRFIGSCGVSNLSAIAKASYLCNELGMDTIDMGGAIACAMELSEKKFLSAKEIGFSLNFGDGKAIVDLVRQTGLREGFGDVLAEGGYRMAEKYEHPELFMGSKKQSFPAYDPRAMKGMGLGFAVSNRGACHVRSGMAAGEGPDPYSIRGKPAILIRCENQRAVLDSAGICVRGMSPARDRSDELVVSLLEPIVGVGYDMETLRLAGERIWNLERMFNIKAGLTGGDDTLPPRMLEEPIQDGPAKGQVNELDLMLPEYYSLRGWDKNGVPTPEKLAELDLA